MQMLCRLRNRLSARGVLFGLLPWLIGGIAAASVMAATAATAVASARSELPASGAQVMHQSVVAWVAQTQSVPAESVALAPLDPRLQIQTCDESLAMDLPFASKQTVRVRCAQPVWQLYVRVSAPEPAATLPAPASTAALSPAPLPELRQVLVAAVPLRRGMRLSAAHVRLAEVDTPGMPVNVLEYTSQVLHAEVVRDVRPGTPLRSHDIRPTVLVKRGQMVLMSVGQTTGFQISARVEAMQDGRYGEQIKLKNRESGRLLSGMVKGPNQVQGL